MAARPIKNMKTLKELVIETKCRTGSADGTTKRGAFWRAVDPILIRSYGGDGIGQSSAKIDHFLHLRHYRSGEVSAVVCVHGWHQNYGPSNNWVPVSAILDCTTLEDVIVALKAAKGEEGLSLYSNWGEGNLRKSLLGLGLIESLPAPDDQPQVAI